MSETPEPVDSPEALAAYAQQHDVRRRQEGPLHRVQDGPTDGTVKTIFNIWVLIFALVGAQMSWVLRPFVGGYGEGGFVWFRPRGGNFFERVVQVIETLLGLT